MKVQTTTSPADVHRVYVASVLIMMVLVQFFYPSIALPTIVSRVAWSLMAGTSLGWGIAIFIHKVFLTRKKTITL